MPGEELDKGVRKLYDWLVPGGKVFVVASTPYRKHLQGFIKEYEQKKITNKYPGEVKDVTKIEPEESDNLPKFFHYLDKEVLRRLFENAGFIIEKAEYLKIDEMPDYLKLDGRENVGIVATKPLDKK